MLENDYIILSNRMRLAMANEILLPVMPGEEYFVDPELYKNVMNGLHKLSMETYKHELTKEDVDDSKEQL